MRAGRLRHRVTIQRGTPGQDAYGAEVLTWSDVATVWAEVHTPFTGNEQTQMDERIAMMTHQVTIRHRNDVTAKMRLLWDGRTLEIIEPPREPDNRMRMMQMNCSEVKDGEA